MDKTRQSEIHKSRSEYFDSGSRLKESVTRATEATIKGVLILILLQLMFIFILGTVNTIAFYGYLYLVHKNIVRLLKLLIVAKRQRIHQHSNACIKGVINKGIKIVFYFERFSKLLLKVMIYLKKVVLLYVEMLNVASHFFCLNLEIREFLDHVWMKSKGDRI